MINIDTPLKNNIFVALIMSPIYEIYTLEEFYREMKTIFNVNLLNTTNYDHCNLCNVFISTGLINMDCGHKLCYNCIENCYLNELCAFESSATCLCPACKN